MPQAIAYLESAWSSAYKVIGTEAASVKTVDMITGESQGCCLGGQMHRTAGVHAQLHVVAGALCTSAKK